MAKENKPEDSNAVGTDKESGRPGAGQGRKDEVGRSGVYPFSGADTPEAAEVRPAGAWGQGERSAAGHEDHDRSRLTYEAGQRAEAHEEGGENLAAHSETGSVEIPPEQWISFFNGDS